MLQQAERWAHAMRLDAALVTCSGIESIELLALTWENCVALLMHVEVQEAAAEAAATGTLACTVKSCLLDECTQGRQHCHCSFLHRVQLHMCRVRRQSRPAEQQLTG
jgi:hypothetical protein